MQKDKNQISIVFNAKIKSYEKLNDKFTKAKCYIQGIGKNRNFTHFSKENVLRNLHTIYYIPVVGHLIETSDGDLYMGSHDVEINLTENGIEYKDLTVPFGFVPYQSEDTLCFEDVLEPNGKIVTYLVGDIILWTGRYPQLLEAVYSDDIYFNESMEVEPILMKPLEEDNNYLDVIDFSYDALCLLGKSDNPEQHTEPCFPCSRIEPYKFSLNSNSEFMSLLEDLKKEFSFYFKKEGDVRLEKEKIFELISEFSLSTEDVDFEAIKDMSEKDIRFELEKISASKTKLNTEGQKYAATYREKLNSLHEVLKDEFITDVNGNVVSETYYWVKDFDDKHVYVEKNTYTSEGSTSVKGRYGYEFSESTRKCSLTSDFEEMVSCWLTLDEKAKLDSSRNTFDLLKQEFDQYKLDFSTPKTEVQKLINSVLDQFEDLSSNNEFIALKEGAYAFSSVDDLLKECYAIRGKSMTKFSLINNENTTLKSPIRKTSEEEPYGGICNSK